MHVAAPEGSDPSQEYVEWARANGGDIHVGHDPVTAVTDADCVVTDTWVSMNQEHRARGHNVFQPYQVNAKLMAKAKPDAIFMHCLPAHRGEEVTDEVLDGPQSVVFDEAENRLHAQKAILAWCLGSGNAS
jgi:ornithine carbamoyltransferase